MNIIGIDISKNKLDCAWTISDSSEKMKFKVVSNSEKGFVELIDWINKLTTPCLSSCHFIMEATGINHAKKEKKLLENLIGDHINQHGQLRKNYTLLLSIPEVGPVISRYMLIIIGGQSFKSASQCAAYIDLMPVQNESGSSFRGRSKISKAGSSVIRAKWYKAAISALKHNPDIKMQNQRLLKNGKSKMTALCAAMRKLVQICFGVIKHQQPYHIQVG